ncbi:MAG: class I SAM-dependent methyltransferase [Arenicella sp.]
METNTPIICPDLDPNLTSQTAAHFGISPTIHPNDYLMHFLFFKSVLNNNETAVLNYYFGNALNCMNNLNTILELAYKNAHEEPKSENIKLLEFASGYGRLTRHLVNDEKFNLTCCDIHEEAVSFLKDTFAVNAFASELTPDQFSTPETYDVVFALSFFSHIPKQYWKPWLRALFDAVTPGGVLVFTTHGLSSKSKHFPTHDFDSEGFHFYADTDQEDIDMQYYGTTLCLPGFVMQQFDEDMELGVFVEGLWWGHQDAYVLRKSE